MDPVKKVQLERRLIMVFALILLALLIKGPLKGLFGSSARHAGAPAKAEAGSGLQMLAKKYSPKVEIDPAILPTTSQPREEPIAAPAYTAQGLRDPFKSWLPDAPSSQSGESPKSVMVVPKAQLPTAPPELLIQGLMWGGPEPKAIIHGNVFGVGERVEGATILAIDHRGVTIEYQGTSISYPVAAPASAASRRLPQARSPMAYGGNWR